MIKTKKKIIVLVALIVLISIIIIPSYVLADDSLKLIDNIDDYGPSTDIKDGDIFLTRASIIINVVSTIGIIISIISLTLIGIKYLFGSVEGKAEYKKAMIPYVVGLFFLTSVSVVILIIKEIALG